MTQTQTELTRESFIKYREGGLSHQEIADVLGPPWNIGRVYRRGQKWDIPPALRTQRRHNNRGNPTFTHQIFAYLNTNGDTLTPRELATTFKLNISTITSILKKWRARNDQPPTDDAQHCTRCTFTAQDNNPILSDGICLWCHADMAGVDLGKIAKETGWDAILEAIETEESTQ